MILLSVIIVTVIILVVFSYTTFIKEKISEQKGKLETNQKYIDISPQTIAGTLIMPYANITCSPILGNKVDLILKIDLNIQYFGTENEFRILPVFDIGAGQGEGNEIVMGKDDKDAKILESSKITIPLNVKLSDTSMLWSNFLKKMNFISITFWKSNACTSQRIAESENNWNSWLSAQSTEMPENSNDYLLEKCPQSYIGSWDFEIGNKPSPGECSICYKCGTTRGGPCTEAECSNLSKSSTTAGCYWTGSECRVCTGSLNDKKDPYSCMMCHENAYWDDSEKKCVLSDNSNCDNIKNKFECISNENCLWTRKGWFGWNSKCERKTDVTISSSDTVCSSSDALKNTDNEVCNLAKVSDCYSLKTGKKKCGPPYECTTALDCVEFCATFGNISSVKSTNCRCNTGICEYNNNGWKTNGWIVDDRGDTTFDWK